MDRFSTGIPVQASTVSIGGQVREGMLMASRVDDGASNSRNDNEGGQESIISSSAI